jgi:hypothetical protein
MVATLGVVRRHARHAVVGRAHIMVAYSVVGRAHIMVAVSCG